MELFALSKELATGHRRVIRSSEILKLGPGLTYRPYNPANVQDFNEGEIYGKVKMAKDGTQYLFKYWIFGLSETAEDARAKIDAIKFPVYRCTGNEKENFSQYTMGQEGLAIKEREKIINASLRETAKNIGDGIVEAFIRIGEEQDPAKPGTRRQTRKEKQSKPPSKPKAPAPAASSESIYRRFVELKKDPAQAQDPERNDGQQDAGLQDFCQQDAGLQDCQQDQHREEPVEEPQGKSQPTLEDLMNIMEETLREVREIKQEQQKIKIQLASLQGQTRNSGGPAIDFTDTRTDEQVEVPEGFVHMGDNIFLKKEYVQKVVTASHESTRWRCKMLCEKMFGEDIKKLWFDIKIDNEPGPSHDHKRAFPPACVQRITEVIAEGSKLMSLRARTGAILKVKQSNRPEEEKLELIKQLEGIEEPTPTDREVRADLRQVVWYERNKGREQGVSALKKSVKKQKGDSGKTEKVPEPEATQPEATQPSKPDDGPEFEDSF